jgi:hypothetical protein
MCLFWSQKSGRLLQGSVIEEKFSLLAFERSVLRPSRVVPTPVPLGRLRLAKLTTALLQISRLLSRFLKRNPATPNKPENANFRSDDSMSNVDHRIITKLCVAGKIPQGDWSRHFTEGANEQVYLPQREESRSGGRWDSSVAGRCSGQLPSLFYSA